VAGQGGEGEAFVEEEEEDLVVATICPATTHFPVTEAEAEERTEEGGHLGFHHIEWSTQCTALYVLVFFQMISAPLLFLCGSLILIFDAG